MTTARKRVSLDVVNPNKTQKQSHPWRLLVVVLGVVATLGLAWWQWTRFQSGSGSFQNLGYALQWPAFGAFFIYAYKKLGEYEDEVRLTGMSPVERQQQLDAERGVVTELDASVLPERPTIDVETFNKINTPTRRKRGH